MIFISDVIVTPITTQETGVINDFLAGQFFYLYKVGCPVALLAHYR